MAVVRFMLKVVLLPVLLIVTLAEWIGIFLTSFASLLFYLFAGLCFILAVFSFLAGISTGPEALRMLVIGFIAFLLPHLPPGSRFRGGAVRAVQRTVRGIAEEAADASGNGSRIPGSVLQDAHETEAVSVWQHRCA